MKCTDCKTELPKNAEVCPKCGRKVFGKPEKITAGILLILLVGCIWYLFGSDSPKIENKPVAVTTEPAKESTPVEPVEPSPIESESVNIPEQVNEPEIADTDIKMVQDTMKQHDLISDISIIVKEDEAVINIAIIANAAIKPNIAREYGEDAARMLANFSSNPKKPDKDSLGGLYDKYELHVGVFTNTQKTIARGAKLKASTKITWR